MPITRILIEVIHSWIWVIGNTFPVRKELKKIGLFYASKKQAWYYRSEEHATKVDKKTLDEIREKYGSEHIFANRRGKAIAQ
jgi:hypothetical protein